MDVERTVQFLLEHQAKFATEIDELETYTTRIASRVEVIIGAVQTLAQVVTTLAETQKATDRRINALVESQQATDQRLNALIGVVDGMIRRQE